MARETLVNQRKGQADQEHEERHCRAVSQLETHKAEAIHVSCHDFAGIDRPALGHDPDQDELWSASQDGQIDACANRAAEQRQGDILDQLPSVCAIDAGSLFDFPRDILQAGQEQQHV